MKGNILGILAKFFASILDERYSLWAALNNGTILPKCRYEYDRTCARTAALAVGKCIRQIDKKNLVIGMVANI